MKWWLLAFYTRLRLFAGLICILWGDHFWKFDGGRPCPINDHKCSQSVYRCRVCGAYDYGEKGGPAWKECRRCVL